MGVAWSSNLAIETEAKEKAQKAKKEAEIKAAEEVEAKKRAQEEAKRETEKAAKANQKTAEANQKTAEANQKAAQSQQKAKREKERATKRLLKATNTIQLCETCIGEAEKLFPLIEKSAKLEEKIKMEKKKIEELKVDRYDENTIVIVVIGYTGQGKSSFCNQLVYSCKPLSKRKDPFKVSSKSKSCTQQISKHVIKITLMNYFFSKIAVVDTPGVGDSFGNDCDHANKLCQYLKGCGGINSFVLVQSRTNCRFDSKIQSMFEQYHKMFGSQFFERLFIVSTFADCAGDWNINQLGKDINDKFGLTNKFPTFSIGKTLHKDVIYFLLYQIPRNKFCCKYIKAPIDDLEIEQEEIIKEINQLKEYVENTKKKIEAEKSEIYLE